MCCWYSAESLGVVCGCAFLITVFVFIPMPYIALWLEQGKYTFPHHEVCSATVSIISFQYTITMSYYHAMSHAKNNSSNGLYRHYYMM